ncbi:VOC family protein [Taibaiella soli]|uniref:VOC family protein n=1 Tax=Taibaiella soli TaxID=1649169 RepID=A0A2W2BF53_9BACT|nr:VOC family protein [Taibaiella soli]PZF74527.1 VOC family protein [Taibaiella soli]
MRTKITPFLLFNTEAGEAAEFYVSVFKGKMLEVKKYPENSPMMAGTVMTASFEIFGMNMVALNWGQEAKYTESISFAIEPDTQEEVDYYWNALIADGGSEGPCGWLKDKYGVSWQVAPEPLLRMMNDKDSKKSMAVMQAMMKMKKIVIADLQAAYDNA